MLLRTASATWFELLTTREDLPRALEALAASGQVELQASRDTSESQLLPLLRSAVDEFRRLSQRYAAFWPEPARTSPQRRTGIEEATREALENLRAWSASAAPQIASLQKLTNERNELQSLRGFVTTHEGPLPNLRALARPGRLLERRLFELGEGASTVVVPNGVLVDFTHSEATTHLLAIGRAGALQQMEQGLRSARTITVPAEIPSDRDGALTFIDESLRRIESEERDALARLETLGTLHSLADACADLGFLHWFMEHVPDLPVTGHFAWVTGWTDARSDTALHAALGRAHLHYLLRFPKPPGGLVPPVVLSNPAWARPFEMFARLLGLPAAREADPSIVLAVLAPCLFGLMFGDVAQGMLLVFVGLLARRRHPALAMLIPGGIAAVLFGFLFGSVLGREDLLPALWVRPLEQPLVLLQVSLAIGGAIILLGLAIDACQHVWAGDGAHWWFGAAGIAACYLALLSGVFIDPRTFWLAPVGLLWFWIGPALFDPGPLTASLGARIGESIETVLQLAVNTLSFMRVGAFALAHAGLASAVTGLAFATRPLWLAWILLALGNVLMVCIEGLVVGIQTTRLILFEFFIRFLRGSGRPFRPLPRPPMTANQHRGFS